MDNNINTFFKLVRAGLWEDSVKIRCESLDGDSIDWQNIYRLAQEQDVLGIVMAGLEQSDVKPPQALLLQWIGEVQMLEQRNKAMNTFIAKLIDQLRKEDVYTLLVKGQGVAQNYYQPYWRASGDIDLYLSEVNYEKAKAILIPLAEQIEKEDKNRLHLGMTIAGWIVELHGTLHTSISRRMNSVSDEVHHDIFYNGNVRSWNNGGVQIFLPSPDNDAIIIFNHFINHFYGEGIGIRQVCDWCRLLYTFRGKLDKQILEQRISKAGLISEWNSFAAFAVEHLGMPDDAMPFYDKRKKYIRKASKIAKLVIETGNFGSKKDYCYRRNGNKWNINIQTFFIRMGEFCRLATIFPLNSPKFFINYIFNRIKAVH